MTYIKVASLLSLIVLFSYACNENGISPNRPEAKAGHDVGNRKTNTTSQSQPSLRYDDLPDLAEFVIDGREWDHTNLTYYFSNGTSDISGNQEQQAIKDAMDFWANVTPLIFTEVSSASSADIVVLWATGAHGDGNPFDGINGILAHAFFPPPNSGSYAGDVHFDDAENWTLSTRSSGSQPIDLTTVAAHELGHSLGLGHSQNQGALMYAYYSGSHRYLSQDDIDGIQNIYGGPPPPPPSPLSVFIDGPYQIQTNQYYDFEATTSGGSPPYSWQWQIDYGDGTGPWQNVGGDSKTYTYISYSSNPQDFNLRVHVIDAENNTTTSPIHPVTVSLGVPATPDTSSNGANGVPSQ